MSAFEADRFNHSRTSPEEAISCQRKPGFLAALGRTILMVHDQRLTTAFKERLQQFGATACEDSAADFYFVVQLRVIQHLHD
jgi:hypothetical protein